MRSVVGDPLAKVQRLNIVSGAVFTEAPVAQWLLRGITSNERYVNGDERRLP
ncbi:MAG: hypothetical protein ACREWG_02620 [Gammaproteobacteria bacterium]